MNFGEYYKKQQKKIGELLRANSINLEAKDSKFYLAFNSKLEYELLIVVYNE